MTSVGTENRQSMCYFLKIIQKNQLLKEFSLLANYNETDKTCWNVARFILNLKHEYKIRKFLFIHHKSISSFAHLMSQKVVKMAMFKKEST